VWEHDGFPQFYIPQSALQNCTWADKEPIKTKDGAGAAIIEIKVPGPKGLSEKSTDRAILFADSEKAAGKLAGLVRLEFASMG
jgi:hypothetical protein